ncbi:hypothetical protein ACHQM5_028282 [Ranunculus cassubicifolius]
MASSSLLLRRSLNKLYQPLRSLSATPSLSTRSFNTSIQRRDTSDDERDLDINSRRPDYALRRRDSPSFFSSVFDPFSPPRTLSQVLNMMDQMVDTPFTSPSLGLRRGWDAREEEDALHLRIDMPGLSKDEVKVSVEENTLSIKGEGGKEEGDEESVRRYSSRIDLPPKLYKVDAIKAEMKNGVLKVFVPKVKEEERKDVHQVAIE